MIELRGLCGGYHGEKKISGISLRFEKGQITALVGPNGCGKSTLLMTAAGLLPALGGEALLEGRPLHGIPRGELAKRISVLPQARNTYSMAAKTLVMHGRFPYLGYPRRYGKEDKVAARRAMERVGILPLAERNMSELSGGERQKVYIAMVVAQDTDVVFLDEPTTYLDIAHQLEIMRLVDGLRSVGKTVIMVLHDLNLALCHADRIAVMQAGVLRGSGTPEQVYDAGVLNEVFGVQIHLRQIEGIGRQYFFSPL